MTIFKTSRILVLTILFLASTQLFAQLFAPVTPYAVGGGPVAVATGDFNRDGKLDLVSANTFAGTISILIGNGSGAFSPASKPSYTLGTHPDAVAVGDFNNDGKLDIVVANEGDSNGFGSSVSILLGNGDGTFQPPVSKTAGFRPVAIVVADFNGDGKLDVAIANVGVFSTNDGTTVTVLQGDGTGGFAAPVDFTVGKDPVSLAVGDLNGDGKPDLVVVNANDGTVSVLINNSNGTQPGFQPASTFSSGSNSADSVAVGDFNGDGKLDFVVAQSGNGSLDVFLGVGDGTFQLPIPGIIDPLGFSGNPQGAVVADLDGDGKLDLVAVNLNGFGKDVVVLLGNGDGTFGAPAYFGSSNTLRPEAQAAVIGDFNGDGKPDLAVANFADDNVGILLNQGTRQPASCFFPAVNYAAGNSPVAISAGDFNLDGKPDLVAANNIPSGTVSRLLGNSNGTFQAAAPYAASTNPAAVAAADFNRDGKPDLVVADFGVFNSNAGDISVLLGAGDGSFGAASSLGVGSGKNPVAVVVGDFNNDGKLDIAEANNNSDVSNNFFINVFLGNGDGTFQAAKPFQLENNAFPSFLAAGDFNRDGKLDLVVANSNKGDVEILIGNGDGTFHFGSTVSVGTSPSTVSVGDFNRDGKLDLVAAYVSSGNANGNIKILLGDGNGGFTAGNTYAVTGINPHSIAIGDFDGDGKVDLAVANMGILTIFGPTDLGNMSLLLGNGDGTFQSAFSLFPGATPEAILAGDFNHDGRPDLAVANFSDNNISVFLNQVCDAGAHHFIVTAPPNVTQSVPFNFRVTAIGASGGIGRNYQGTAHFTSTDSAAVLPADYAFTSGDNGIHLFSGTLKTAGTWTITAADTVTGSITGTSGGITAAPGPVDHFRVTVFVNNAPSTQVGQGVAYILEVKAVDVNNNLVPNYSGTVHFTSSDGAATLPGDYTFVPAQDRGVHDFLVTFQMLGSQTLTATDTGNSSIKTTVTLQVLKATTISVASGRSSYNLFFMEPPVYTITVTGLGGGVPTGTVALEDVYQNAGNLLGEGTLSGGQLIFTLPRQQRSEIYELGHHQIVVSYSGDTNFVGTHIFFDIYRSPGPRRLPRP
jgi:hypothetical protein